MVTTCLLAGGQGLRMQGRDKGLVDYKGQVLASWVLRALTPQSDRICISANRNLQAYADLLAQHQTNLHTPAEHVWPDDSDLPANSGPLAGILTALRRVNTDWLMIAPCDTPDLPANLIHILLDKALSEQADIVVPETHPLGDEPRLHWVCALVNKRVYQQTEDAFVKGERKVGNWVRSLNWVSVSFSDDAAFKNMNTLVTLHDRA